MLVRVTLSTRHHFLTTLSPVRLPYSSVWRGVSRDKYIEIDTNFAKQLGISTPNLDTEVCVIKPLTWRIMQGSKCLHPKPPVIFKEKTELPWVGFKPATSHVLDMCGVPTELPASWLSRIQIIMLGNARQLSLINW